MKQLSRLPRWLRVLLPMVLISACVAINTIAFTEIIRTFQSRRLLSVPSAVAEPLPTESLPAESLPAEPSPAEPSPNNVIETAATRRTETSSSPVSDVAPTDSLPKYGHFPYPVSAPTDMLLIASYAQGEDQRYETLHPDAAAALLKMVAAARADGVWLVPASGFRTIAQQRSLFTAQVASKGTPEAAALVSAPPGYSEHHTGYAVDLADGSVTQDYDISASFAQTPAYQWLVINAATFGFELSFPENNEQGISFEPWHWRYIGTPEAKALFYPDSAQPSEKVDNTVTETAEVP